MCECLKLQADAETDEVYAQMTLQPLSAVGLFLFSGIWISWLSQFCFHLLCFFLNYELLCYAARIEGSLPSSRVGHSE